METEKGIKYLIITAVTIMVQKSESHLYKQISDTFISHTDAILVYKILSTRCVEQGTHQILYEKSGNLIACSKIYHCSNHNSSKE